MPLWVEISPLKSYIRIKFFEVAFFSPKYVWTFEFRISVLRTFYNFSHVCSDPACFYIFLILQAQYNFCLKIGDGTEDISCRMDTTNWTVEEDVTGKFSAAEAEDYWKSLRIHFIGFLVYPRVFSQQSQFPVKIGKVPPILNPKIAGPELFNTEHVKDSYVLKNIDEIQGSQNKLIELIVTKELELSSLDKMTNDELKQICQSLDFQRISRLIIHTFSYILSWINFSVPTMASKKKEILKLYESILTGASKCHATGNEKDASGGWYCVIKSLLVLFKLDRYTFVCRHGVIYGSKLLFLRHVIKLLICLI